MLQLAEAPIHGGKIGQASSSNAEADVERQLAALKDL